MICHNCSKGIEMERLSILPDTKICAACAQKVSTPKMKGVICFGHKTGGFMQTISPEAFKDWRRYNPYGRYTGRGSGVHRMMSSSNR